METTTECVCLLRFGGRTWREPQNVVEELALRKHEEEEEEAAEAAAEQTDLRASVGIPVEMSASPALFL